MGGWMDGWMGGKAGLRIAYSNQKYWFILCEGKKVDVQFCLARCCVTEQLSKVSLVLTSLSKKKTVLSSGVSRKRNRS